jgi:hypothetical protein
MCLKLFVTWKQQREMDHIQAVGGSHSALTGIVRGFQLTFPLARRH